MPGPLSHLTILDLSRVLAGPWCTQLLADLGASCRSIASLRRAVIGLVRATTQAPAGEGVR